jgi:hypothetical protein
MKMMLGAWLRACKGNGQGSSCQQAYPVSDMSSAAQPSVSGRHRPAGSQTAICHMLGPWKHQQDDNLQQQPPGHLPSSLNTTATACNPNMMLLSMLKQWQDPALSSFHSRVFESSAAHHGKHACMMAHLEPTSQISQAQGSRCRAQG